MPVGGRDVPVGGRPTARQVHPTTFSCATGFLQRFPRDFSSYPGSLASSQASIHRIWGIFMKSHRVQGVNKWHCCLSYRHSFVTNCPSYFTRFHCCKFIDREFLRVDRAIFLESEVYWWSNLNLEGRGTKAVFPVLLTLHKERSLFLKNSLLVFEILY